MSAVADEVRSRLLPDGRRLEFVETPRRAYRLFDGEDDEKGKRLPSVTTVLDVLSKPALYRWYEARGAEAAVRAVQLGEIDPENIVPEEAIDRVRALDLGADAAKTKAADRGLDVHDGFEYWCAHGDLPRLGEFAVDVRPFWRGLAAFLHKYQPEPVHTERMICHPELLYAGRLDFWGTVDGLTACLDLKTNPRASVYDSACLQLDGYVSAEVACGEEPPTQQLVVSIGLDGEYTAQPSSAEPGDFAAVFDLYERMKRVRRPLDAAYRARQRAAKEAATS